MSEPLHAGLDIGGTKTDAVAVTRDGSIVHRVRVPTGYGPVEVVSTAVEVLDRLARLAGVTAGEFTTIGIGIPGAVDPQTGGVRHAVNLGFETLELGTELQRRLGRAVRVENDVNAAALGAFQLLDERSDQSMAYLNLGTGLAVGIVLDGRLWRGARGIAGEIGHIPVDPDGPRCSCGQRGCLEAVASGSAIARRWTGARPATALFTAAAAGEPEALRARDSFVVGVAAAARLLVLTFDVEHVVVGGGLSGLGTELLDRVRVTLQGWERDSAFVASTALSRRISLVPADFPAAAVGAASVGIAATTPLAR